MELTDIFLKIKEKKTKMKQKSWIKLSPLKWLFFMLLFSTYGDMLQFLILLQWRSWCYCSFCGDTCMDKIPQFSDYWWMAIMVCWWPDCRVKQCFSLSFFSFSLLLLLFFAILSPCIYDNCGKQLHRYTRTYANNMTFATLKVRYS